MSGEIAAALENGVSYQDIAQNKRRIASVK